MSIANQLPKKFLWQFGQPLAMSGGNIRNGHDTKSGQSRIFRDMLFSTNRPDTRLVKAPNIIPPIAKFRIVIASFTFIFYLAYNAVLNGAAEQRSGGAKRNEFKHLVIWFHFQCAPYLIKVALYFYYKTTCREEMPSIPRQQTG